MSLKYFIDTLLNISVFAFIGILIWLYFKKESGAHPDFRNELTVHATKAEVSHR